MPVSRRKSPEPKARRKAPTARPMFVASSRPRADSMSGTTQVVPPRRWKVSVTCSGASAFASTTPSRVSMPRSCSMSSSQKSLVTSLMRTQPRLPCWSHAMTSARASSFLRGSTASSASRMTTSARESRARSKSSGLDAGTSSHERACSAGTLWPGADFGWGLFGAVRAVPSIGRAGGDGGAGWPWLQGGRAALRESAVYRSLCLRFWEELAGDAVRASVPSLGGDACPARMCSAARTRATSVRRTRLRGAGCQRLRGQGRPRAHPESYCSSGGSSGRRSQVRVR